MDNRASNETLCRFRRQKLAELQRQLESCAAGHFHAVMPFITNRQKQYSEQNTLRLINRLLRLPELEAASDDLCSFYKSLLYCAVRAFAAPCKIRQGGTTLGVYDPDFTFGDLILYLHSEELEVCENDGFSMSFGVLHRPWDNSLSITMTALYTFLSGKAEPVPSPFDGYFIPRQTFSVEEDNFTETADPSELSKIDCEPYLEEESCQLEGTFPASDKYCAHFENLLALFPEQYRKESFDLHMEHMIDHFLTEQDMTVFSDRDNYLTAIVYLKKALKIIQDAQN